VRAPYLEHIGPSTLLDQWASTVERPTSVVASLASAAMFSDGTITGSGGGCDRSPSRLKPAVALLPCPVSGRGARTWRRLRPGTANSGAGRQAARGIGTVDEIARVWSQITDRCFGRNLSLHRECLAGAWSASGLGGDP